MRTTVRAILVAVCLVLPSLSVLAKDSTCGLKRYASLEFKITRNGLLVPATVRSHAVWMVLNLQSPITILYDRDVAQYLTRRDHLPADQEMDFGTQRVKEYGTTETFLLDSLNFTKIQFLIVDAPADPTVIDGKPIIGAMGLDVVSQVDFELDFAQRRLNLYSPEHCRGSVVYWADRYGAVPLTRGPIGSLNFPLELDGHQIMAHISTSSLATSLPTDVTRKLYHFDTQSPDVEHETDSAGHPHAHFRAMALTTQGLAVTNARVQLIDPFPHCSLAFESGKSHAARYDGCIGREAPLTLGMGVLQHLHLYFATKEKMLYFTAAETGHDPAATQPLSAPVATAPTDPTPR